MSGSIGIAAAILTAGPLFAAPAQQPALSVLTYNVEGLPWPVALGRAGCAHRIAAGLRRLRDQGTQPHIIVLQEAFTAAAKAIATDAGYRYMADGPARDDVGAVATRRDDKQFLADASTFAGETVGKWADSGLRIASDYPILAVRRLVFPAYACAGYDCLANKGALAVLVAVPGLPQRVVIVATHLNSRTAAGVPFTRSFYAYRRQVDALGAFLNRAVPQNLPLVLAGDFNAGRRFDRRGYLARSAALWRPNAGIAVALDDCLAAQDCTQSGAADIRFTAHRARDWQFFSPGRLVGLRVSGLAVPFGHDAAGRMLSDHVGYTASYSVGPVALPAATIIAAR